jgi:sugar phosphate isomerase/epimerase
MISRRHFIRNTGVLAMGAMYMPNTFGTKKLNNVGIQLYTVRDEMMKDAVGTLKQLAKIGYKQLESAGSDKGNYYGLQPKEMKKITGDLGMTVRSGHVHLDDKWTKTIDDAKEAGQEYLIVSSMPFRGQTISNYEKTADAFSKAGEECKKAGLKFGYHNHDFEFEKDGDQVLYDVLLDKTDASLVNMEMDLGWVIVTGNDPLKYFEKYPGRFPLWHLKDMNIAKKESTEFGKGNVDIGKMLQNTGKSGLKYFFVEQEEYTNNAFESAKYDFDFLKKY